MNRTRALIKYGTWTYTELRAYYVGERATKSAYGLKEDFRPGVLGTVAPLQLHKTERAGGVYLHQWAGGLDLAKKVEDMLCVGFTYGTMEGALRYLKQYLPEEAAVIDRLANRTRHVTGLQVATAMGIPIATFYRMVRRGVEVISDYLDAYLNGVELLEQDA